MKNYPVLSCVALLIYLTACPAVQGQEVVERFPSGQVRSVVQLRENKLHGEAVIYFENGKIQRQGTYRNGELVGSFKAFFESGQLAEAGQAYGTTCAVLGCVKKQGLWNTYFQSGQLKSEVHYQDDVPHGEATIYYESGQIDRRGTYQHGQLTGLFQSFHENGQIKARGEAIGPTCIVLGCVKQHGLWITYYENGTVQSEVEYDEGVLRGRATTYYPNGQPRYSGLYLNGELAGTFSSYYDTGRLQTMGDAYGTTCGLLACVKRTGLWSYCHANGAQDASGYFKDDHKDGVWIHFGEDGRVINVVEHRYEAESGNAHEKQFDISDLDAFARNARRPNPCRSQQAVAKQPPVDDKETEDRQPEIRTAQGYYVVGEEITVLYSGFPDSESDWISIAKEGAPAEEYEDYEWTTEGDSGKVVLDGQEAGVYEARAYFDWQNERPHYLVRTRQTFEVVDAPQIDVKLGLDYPYLYFENDLRNGGVRCGSSDRVKCAYGHESCANAALGIAANAATNLALAEGAFESFKIAFTVGKQLAPLYGFKAAAEVVDVALKALESDSKSDFLRKVAIKYGNDKILLRSAMRIPISESSKEGTHYLGDFFDEISESIAGEITESWIDELTEGGSGVVKAGTYPDEASVCADTRVIYRLDYNVDKEVLTLEMVLRGDCNKQKAFNWAEPLGPWEVTGRVEFDRAYSPGSEELQIQFRPRRPSYEVIAVCR